MALVEKWREWREWEGAEGAGGSGGVGGSSCFSHHWPARLALHQPALADHPAANTGSRPPTLLTASGVPWAPGAPRHVTSVCQSSVGYSARYASSRCPASRRAWGGEREGDEGGRWRVGEGGWEMEGG